MHQSFVSKTLTPSPPPADCGDFTGNSGGNTASLHIEDAPYLWDFTSHSRLHSIKHGHCQ